MPSKHPAPASRSMLKRPSPVRPEEGPGSIVGFGGPARPPPLSFSTESLPSNPCALGPSFTGPAESASKHVCHASCRVQHRTPWGVRDQEVVVLICSLPVR